MRRILPVRGQRCKLEGQLTQQVSIPLFRFWGVYFVADESSPCTPYQDALLTLSKRHPKLLVPRLLSFAVVLAYGLDRLEHVTVRIRDLL